VDFDHAGFDWIDCHDRENSIVSFVRRARDGADATVIVVNFTPVTRLHYRVGVPGSGWYRELLNSDAGLYGGSNVGNDGGRMAEAVPADGREYSLELSVPPLGCLFLKK
jgi:1,4-alpha-glucan branching enzyme